LETMSGSGAGGLESHTLREKRLDLFSTPRGVINVLKRILEGHKQRWIRKEEELSIREGELRKLSRRRGLFTRGWRRPATAALGTNRKSYGG